MQQTEFTDSFIKGMLGWIRWIASSISDMFQSGSSHSTGGMPLVSWFAGNWIKILLALIVLGVLVDWVVWMARWRPYWIWFRKRRILLDNEVDDIDDDDLMLHYADMGMPRARRQRDDGYDDRYAEDDRDDLDDDAGDAPEDDFDEDEDEDYRPYDGDEDEAEEDEADEAYRRRYDDEADEPPVRRGPVREGEDFDALYDDRRAARNRAALPEAADALEPEPPDGDEAPRAASRPIRVPARRGLFARRAKAGNEEDPFSIEGDFFDDLGEDPMDDVIVHQRKARPERDAQDTSVYKRPLLLPGDEPGAVRGATGDEGWHSGYTQRSVERGRRRKRDAGA